MPEKRDRADHPAIQAAARLPTYIALSLVIVALTAGALLAARGPANNRDRVVAGDIAETPLPTPVPLETGTPLPAPLGTLDRTSIVDTAVAFWVAWIPDEVADNFRAAISAAGSQSASTPTASTPSPDVSSATAPPSEQTDGAGVVAVPAVTAPLPAPVASPIPPIPLPSVPLPVPTPTLPPLLP